jgi:hypothetical protein
MTKSEVMEERIVRRLVPSSSLSRLNSNSTDKRPAVVRKIPIHVESTGKVQTKENPITRSRGPQGKKVFDQVPENKDRPNRKEMVPPGVTENVRTAEEKSEERKTKFSGLGVGHHSVQTTIHKFESLVASRHQFKSTFELRPPPSLSFFKEEDEYASPSLRHALLRREFFDKQPMEGICQSPSFSRVFDAVRRLEKCVYSSSTDNLNSTPSWESGRKEATAHVKLSKDEQGSARTGTQLGSNLPSPATTRANMMRPWASGWVRYRDAQNNRQQSATGNSPPVTGGRPIYCWASTPALHLTKSSEIDLEFINTGMDPGSKATEMPLSSSMERIIEIKVERDLDSVAKEISSRDTSFVRDLMGTRESGFDTLATKFLPLTITNENVLEQSTAFPVATSSPIDTSELIKPKRSIFDGLSVKLESDPDGCRETKVSSMDSATSSETIDSGVSVLEHPPGEKREPEVICKAVDMSLLDQLDAKARRADANEMPGVTASSQWNVGLSKAVEEQLERSSTSFSPRRGPDGDGDADGEASSTSSSSEEDVESAPARPENNNLTSNRHLHKSDSGVLCVTEGGGPHTPSPSLTPSRSSSCSDEEGSGGNAEGDGRSGRLGMRKVDLLDNSVDCDSGTGHDWQGNRECGEVVQYVILTYTHTSVHFFFINMID